MMNDIKISRLYCGFMMVFRRNFKYAIRSTQQQEVEHTWCVVNHSEKLMYHIHLLITHKKLCYKLTNFSMKNLDNFTDYSRKIFYNWEQK